MEKARVKFKGSIFGRKIFVLSDNDYEELEDAVNFSPLYFLNNSKGSIQTLLELSKNNVIEYNTEDICFYIEFTPTNEITFREFKRMKNSYVYKSRTGDYILTVECDL